LSDDNNFNRNTHIWIQSTIKCFFLSYTSTADRPY
jgi:hypothetical protein